MYYLQLIFKENKNKILFFKNDIICQKEVVIIKIQRESIHFISRLGSEKVRNK